MILRNRLALMTLVLTACSLHMDARSTSIAEPTATATPFDAGTLQFEAQPGWIEQTPSSSMRVAQFSLPGEAGVAGDASCVVYHFGGVGAGGVAANLERWIGQFEQPDGRDSHDVAVQETATHGALTITRLELGGTYVAEMRPGSGELRREEGWRMLAAVIMSRCGPYYAKLVGPDATVRRWKASFGDFLASMRS